jgi:hypothetical protein
MDKITTAVITIILMWFLGLGSGIAFQKGKDKHKAFQERIQEHACKIEKIEEGNPITICVQPDGRIFYK